MTRFFNYLFLITFITLTFSCSEDVILDKFEHSKVEDFGTHRLTTFRLPHRQTATATINDSVDIIQIGGNYVEKLKANISKFDNSQSIVELTIPNSIGIPDGTYVIKFDTTSNNRFIAEINTEKIAINEINNGNYTEFKKGINAGDGTKINPYKVGTNNLFNKLIFALSTDPYKGAGFYFIQTNDIQWSNDESNQGEGLSSQTFAGVYDGNYYSLNNITINGKEKAGIFTTLTNGATIKNLTLNYISFSNGKTMGAIAGVSEYTVKLSNIETSGNISGTEVIGGLIGSVSGNLYLDNISINSSITGTKNVGGAIGQITSGSYCSIQTFNISNSFRVGSDNVSNLNNAENVGGIIGRIENASFDIENAYVVHTSSEGDNVKIVAGNINVGGIIGEIANLSSPSKITNSKVISPILTNNYGGGFIGQAYISNELSITDCQSCPIMKQGNYIGGIIGKLEYTTENLLSYSNNNVIASDNSDIKISGGDYVGGLFGFLNVKFLSLKGENYIMTDIQGNSKVGGLVGAMANSTLDIGIPLYGKAGTTITGLNIKASSIVGGIVGEMETSLLKGPQLLSPTSGINKFDEKKASMICTVNGSGNSIGGAVGNAYYSNIEGISVKATVNNNNDKGIYTGGIVGYFDNGNKAVTNCSFSGIVAGKNYTGGIVGEINKLGQITQCINYGEITGGEKTGGICGKINNEDDEPYISKCVNIGSITGRQLVGGIVGFISADGSANDWTKISTCGNYGSVTASSSGDGCVGGIVGQCDSDKIRVNHSANHGTITGNGSFKGIGGIAGTLGRDGILNELDNVDVYNCTNTGKIISDKAGGAHMGGIVGYMQEGDEGSEDTNSEVHLCYNCGEVGPSKSETHGGIIGHCDYYVSLRYCINYGHTFSGGESMIGTVEKGGIVHDYALYHLNGTGDHEGRNWSSTSFEESEMDKMSTFKNLSDTKWVVGQQLNMKDGEKGKNESSKSRVILIDCPFQNIIYKQ